MVDPLPQMQCAHVENTGPSQLYMCQPHSTSWLFNRILPRSEQPRSFIPRIHACV